MAVRGNREFEFSDASFERIRQFVTEHTGIVLSDAKKDMVYGRLSKRIRKGGFGSFDGFCDALESGDLEAAEVQLQQTAQKLDKIASTSTMHKKTAARKKSRLTKQLKTLKAKSE